MVAASAVADLAAQALAATTTRTPKDDDDDEQQQQEQQQLLDVPLHQQEPPPPLPAGWFLKESRSQPGVFYYYNQETGESTWDSPQTMLQPEPSFFMDTTTAGSRHDEQDEEQQITPPTAVAAPKKKENNAETTIKMGEDEDPYAASRPSKRPAPVIKKEEQQEDEQQPPAKRQRKAPKEVRVLHILKKHKDSKRPASWRSNNQPITISREEAKEELEGLLEILKEEESNPANLIATFKGLASQESDCSSAKRKGDLGTFGRKKMRPEFEEAAFGLEINELSGIVETASGAHILLRLE